MEEITRQLLNAMYHNYWETCWEKEEDGYSIKLHRFTNFWGKPLMSLDVARIVGGTEGQTPETVYTITIAMTLPESSSLDLMIVIESMKVRVNEMEVAYRRFGDWS